MLEILLAAKANPNHTDGKGNSLLAYTDKPETARLLLEKGVSLYKGYPLHNAVESGNLELVRLFLEKGSAPNSINMNGETAVHIAAMKDKQDIAKLLMAKGGDAKMKNFKGKTPLDIAKDAKNKQMTLILKKIKK